MPVSQFWNLLEGLHLFCQKALRERPQVIAKTACFIVFGGFRSAERRELDGRVIAPTACAINDKT
jgi:hypothetical protein